MKTSAYKDCSAAWPDCSASRGLTVLLQTLKEKEVTESSSSSGLMELLLTLVDLKAYPPFVVMGMLALRSWAMQQHDLKP